MRDNRGLVRARDALLELTDAAAEIRGNRDAVERAYMARQLVLCTLPHSDPGDAASWSRAAGNFAFGIQAGLDAFTNTTIGLPYGTLPRLLLYWVNSEAVRTKSTFLHLGDSLADFMRELGLDPTRGGVRSDAYRLKEQAKRLFSASITFQQKYPEIRRDLKIGTAQLWWTPKTPHQVGLWDSHIELTEEFFRAITEAPVPLDMRALRSLKRSPLALDLYSLLGLKAFIAGRKNVSQEVTWRQLQRQFGSDYDDLGNFRKKVKAALLKVQAVSPGLRITPQDGGFLVLASSFPPVRPR